MVENVPNLSGLFSEGLHLSKEALGQVVSWDRRRDLPLTLGDYMASHAPARTLREFSLRRSRRLVRTIDELSEEEVRKVVIARLKQMPEGLSVNMMSSNY